MHVNGPRLLEVEEDKGGCGFEEGENTFRSLEDERKYDGE
jgi:hypothetical protein